MEFEVLKDLNDEQKEAVTSTEGYVRVIAGAGSGKTKALTSRYIYLVKELGISTANILCVTFTNKAAKEMKKRIRNIIGDNDTGLICTFHSFCRQLLREDIHVINYPSNFIVMDTEDMSSVLKIVYEQANITSRQYTFSNSKDMIGIRKGRMEHIPYILEMDSNVLKQKFISSENIDDKIFFGYLYQQRKSFNLDFNDLITIALYILNTFQEKREKWQKRLEYVMVDEFQDVSSSQYVIASLLSEYHKNLFVVGDPDQTIYSWRGACIEFILNFDKQFSNVKTIIMNTNYRSSENILNASNSLINKNEKRIKKELRAIKKSKIPVIYNHSKTIYDEARWISNQIKEIIKSGNKYNDVCILYRAHYVSRSIEEILIKEKMPYVLYSGVGFYERKEIKDVLSYLRMIVFEDDLSLIRIINEPKRNFGKKRMEIIRTYSEKNNCSLFNALKYNIEDKLILKSKVSEFVDLVEKYQKIYKEMTITDLLTAVLNDSGYEAMLRQSGEDERLDNLAELKSSIVDYESSAGEETSLEDYLQEIALYSNSDMKEEQDKIKMMTIHTAKGLEFPYVFICGLNEGIFPSQRANTQDKLEEERRLAYVGYTRAENALFLSESEGFNYDGSCRYPSRFIFNTDKRYLNYTVKLDKNLIEDANDFINITEKKLKGTNDIKFKIGDKIIHNIFGVGTIKEINSENLLYIIKFDKTTTNRSIRFSAKLSEDNNNINSNFISNNDDSKIRAEQEKERREKEEKIRAEQEEVRRKKEDKIRAEQEEARRIEEDRLMAILEAVKSIKEENLRAEQEKVRREKEEKIRAEQEEARRRKEEKIRAEEEKVRRIEEDRLMAILEAVKSIKEEKLRAEQEEVRRREEEDEVKRLDEKRLKIEQEKKEIVNAIRKHEEIINKNKYTFFGKGVRMKKHSKEQIIILKTKLNMFK
ncbi:ATP-dependent DNA helicase PcrA [Clostridium sartagoforme AAU1]|uniref:DNA 3'-5' helicase n=1 Tax=Clostridium sartagoforme AAU1 TaxID=1202534 RepID=R9BTF7_9CLOT|nr:UvrD-helicase domain-containing protein [Clostridium sartagoforme]EOR20414.1 ATP-dependent DNA helicase PcrA [Clostridium sartagoforme AAU1]